MLHLYNDHHLGDCLWTAHYAKHLVDHNVTLYVRPRYAREIAHLCSPCEHVVVRTTEAMSTTKVEPINMWIGRNDYFYNSPLSNKYNEFYLDFFKHMSDYMCVGCPFVINQDLLFDDYRIDDTSNNPLAQPFDVLMIDSPGESGQWLDMRSVDEFTKHLRSLGLQVVTTNTDTRREGLDLLQIAQLSVCCRYVVGINTAPLHMCFNVYNRLTCANWFVLDKDTGYSYPRTHHVRTVEELNALRRFDWNGSDITDWMSQHM